MTDRPRAFAYADGYGTWHARVPKDCVSPLIAARRLLRPHREEPTDERP